MRPLLPAYRVATLCALLLVAAACGTSPPTRFYTLSPLPRPTEAITQERTVAIGIGPIELAAYVDRQEIVTRRGPNELGISEFHLWAEPLDSNLSQVLVENLSVLLSAEPVLLSPFPGSTPVDYRVPIKILRLEGKLGGNASLVARWSLSGEEGREVLPARESNFTEPTGGEGYEALVSAQSRALGALSREIAQAIRPVLQERNKR